MKRRIVLLGPPASGKGTQAELIQKRFGIPATSTGAILRREAKLGIEAHQIISKGGLAPDDLILQLAAAWLTDFYERRGILARVNGDRNAGPVFDDLSQLVIA